MIGRRMANIIKRFARHRDDMRFANFQRVRGFDAEWKLLRCPTEYCLPANAPIVGGRTGTPLTASVGDTYISGRSFTIFVLIARSLPLANLSPGKRSAARY